MGEEGTDLEKKIAEIFDVFDHAGNKSVDVREVGTIIRALGCCPSEQDIQEVIAQVEDEQASGSVQYDKFLPYIMEVIRENKMQPADPELLLKAFLVLDEEKKGYLTKEELTKGMMEEGEQFTQEEVDEMLAVAVDTETGNIPYEYYINQLMMTKDIYNLKSQEMEKAKADKKSIILGSARRSTVASLRKTLEITRRSFAENLGEEVPRASEANISRSSKSPSQAGKQRPSAPVPVPSTSTSTPGAPSQSEQDGSASPSKAQSPTGGAGSPIGPFSPTGTAKITQKIP